MVNLNFQSIFKIWNSYPHKKTNFNLNLELEFQIHEIFNQSIFKIWWNTVILNLVEHSHSQFGGTQSIFNSVEHSINFLLSTKNQIWIWIWKRVNLNWISNSWHSINFQNLELLSTKFEFEFEFMTFNQFPKFGTPIHKKTNLNLNLKEGQLELNFQFITFN